MEKLYCLTMLFVLPFIISFAFYYGLYVGVPTLVVLGIGWIWCLEQLNSTK